MQDLTIRVWTHMSGACPWYKSVISLEDSTGTRAPLPRVQTLVFRYSRKVLKQGIIVTRFNRSGTPGGKLPHLKYSQLREFQEA